jgi:hypothetical protein
MHDDILLQLLLKKKEKWLMNPIQAQSVNQFSDTSCSYINQKIGSPPSVDTNVSHLDPSNEA